MHLPRLGWISAGVLLVLAIFGQQSWAMAPWETGVALDSPELEVKLGLAGVWKVGYPVRASVKAHSARQPLQGRIQIQTFDGDGVVVLYENPAWKVDIGPNSSAEVEVAFKNGRANRPIIVRVIDADQRVIVEHTLDSNERGTTLPATQPWIVGIGSDKLDLDQASMRSARGALPEYTTTELTSAAQLPSSSFGYEGIDLLIFSSSNRELNQSLTDAQIKALLGWIGQGGRCLLTMGSQADSWSKRGSLAILIPGTLKSVSTGCEPGPLESFLGSQSRLSNLTCAVTNLTGGVIDLSTQDNSRTKFPLIAKWAYGSGKIVFLGTELDSPELLEWESRPALLKLLFDDQWEKKNVKTDKLAYQGYDDFSGQLNATLDNFPDLKLGSLTSISLIVGLLCMLIGPADYFLIARAWRKPRATWLTLLICSVGSCLVAAAMTSAWKPSASTINSLELVDIDYQTQKLSGRGFARCYGGQRGAYDFVAHRQSQGLNAASVSGLYSIQLDWFGQPGKGLGGFDSSVATDRGMPAYRIQMSGIDQPSTPQSPAATEQSSDGRSNENDQGIYGVGIPFAGTKAMFARWNEPITIPADTHSLSMVDGQFDLLEGAFVNPLDVDLLDAILIYRGRAYTLPTRFRSGEVLNLSVSTLPKDITRRLQRRQQIAGEEKGSPWDPGDTTKIGRLMELISFHEAASGSNYTSLYNRYLSPLDCSDVVRLDRAIVFAEIRDASLVWSMKRNGVPVQANEGQRKTYVRLIVPVAKPIKKPTNSLRPINPSN